MPKYKAGPKAGLMFMPWQTKKPWRLMTSYALPEENYRVHWQPDTAYETQEEAMLAMHHYNGTAIEAIEK